METTGEFVKVNKKVARPTGPAGLELPAIITDQGERTTRRFLEFFAVSIYNPNTREAYARSLALL
jgi:hypothetical protein